MDFGVILALLVGHDSPESDGCDVRGKVPVVDVKLEEAGEKRALKLMLILLRMKTK